MAVNDIGRVTPIWRGPYSAATEYELNDIVIDANGSVWWHKGQEKTTGTAPAEGAIWSALIDMRVFGDLIRESITTAQNAVEAAQAAEAGVEEDVQRAETAAQNAEAKAEAAAESEASAGAYAQSASNSETEAQGYAASAESDASDAEAYGAGTRGGTPVGSSDPAYHNNAAYYADRASSADAAASSAESSASAASTSANQASASAASAETSKDTASAAAAAAALSEQNAAASASAASSSETAAQGYATSAEADASDAEAYGAGTRDGTPVGSTDPAYHNNAAYYADQASSAEASATSAASSASAAGTSAAAAADSAMAAAGSAQAAESSVLGSNFAPYITNTLTAPANITAGEYVVAAGVMYRATVNIASGSTLTPNGNVSAVTVGEELTKVIASDARKADADGTSPNLTAGNALQLVSTVGVEDQVPYNFRASGGGADIGDRETDMIVGGTVAWNQWFDDNTPNVSSGATITGSDGVYTFTAGAQNDQVYMQQRSSLVVANHVYLCSVTFSTSDPANVKVRMFSQDIESDDTTGWQTKVKFRKSASTSSFTVGVRDTRASGWDGVAVKWFMLFDLTQMFGTTIADYVYSLEQANAGDGVAWFKKLFPNDYYAYDAGTLRSVQTSAHKMVGFNAFDKNASDVTLGKYLDANGAEQSQSNSNITGYIPVIGGQTYYFANASNGALGRYMFWYDSGKNIISGGLIPYLDGRNVQTAPANARYVRVSVRDELWDTYVVNLSWDGERDGEYEPYQAWNYPLDDSLTLRGVPTIDANNKLRYDGDTYASDGTVTRKYGIVDLGTLTWTYNSTAEVFATTSALPNVLMPVGPYDAPNAVCAALEVVSYQSVIHGTPPTITIIFSSGSGAGRLYGKHPDYTDVASFKTAMSGVYLVYKLDTPTTETADSYTNPQIVDDFGTEEYVDAGVEAGARDVAIPVGHETFYQANLRAKLEAAPDSPDGDGDYILRQTGGENVYVPLVVPDELPEAPSTDGTYVLQVTVADGEPTYSWVSAT